MSAIVLSDIHLRDPGSIKEKLVIRFFQEVASRFEDIYILGDLFDVWPGTSAFLVRRYGAIIHVLKHLVEGGHRVHYLEGNHDFRLGSFFQKKIGVKIYPDHLTQDWGGKKVFLSHGDLGNPKNIKYRAVRGFLRWDLVHLVRGCFPQDWIYEFGLKSSKLSRFSQRNYWKKEESIRQIYRRTAEKLFDGGYDVVVMGHTHIPDNMETLVHGRKCLYYNVGDWVTHFTYLEFDGSRFYTKTHPVKEL